MYARSFVCRACAALSILSLCALGRAASAQNAFYTTGTYTVDAAHSITGFAYAGEDSSGNFTDNQNHPYNPTVNVVTGGSIGTFLQSYNSATMNISGGSTNVLYADDNSTVNVSGGSITATLNAQNSSHVNVSGGSIGDALFAYQNSTVNIYGGSVRSFTEADGTSTVTISGGTFGKFLSYGVNFFDRTSGAFTLIGYNLTATNLGADSNYFGGTDYALSGTLQGGTNLSGYVLNVAGGAQMFTLQNITSVPEPSRVALLVGLATTGAFFLSRHRKVVQSAT